MLNREKKLFKVYYYDMTGHRGVIEIEAYYPIQAGQRFLSNHPSCTLNYIEEKEQKDYGRNNSLSEL